MIQGLTYVVLATDDLARAREFFVEQLGLVPDGADETFVQFPGGAGTTFGLLQERELAGETLLYFQVADADRAYHTWRERGVRMVSEPQDRPFGRTFAFLGPDGRTLYAWVPGDPAA